MRKFERDEEKDDKNTPKNCTATNCCLKAAFPSGETHAFCSFHEGQSVYDWQQISENIKYHLQAYRQWCKLSKLSMYEFNMNRDSYENHGIANIALNEGESLITYRERVFYGIKELMLQNTNRF